MVSQVAIVRSSFAAILAAAVLSSGAYGHEGMATGTKEQGHHRMHQVMEGMHKEMMGMKSKGNTDQDFVAMMIHHHQGAIEMAQVELAEGTDAQAKEFAKKTIEQQKKEIEELQTWQKNHAGAKRAAK